MPRKELKQTGTSVWQAAIDASPWFAQWSDQEKRGLLGCATELKFSAGQTLYAKGELAKGIYLILSGSVKIMVPSFDGDEAVIDVMGEGQWLGELGVIDRQPRQHTAQVLDACVCVCFDKNYIESVLQQNPALYQGIALLLCERLRGMFLWGEESLLSSVKTRILYRLRHIASGLGAPLEDGLIIRSRISQELLAAMLGVTRQTLNKELTGLKAAGLIKKIGAYYWIKNG